MEQRAIKALLEQVDAMLAVLDDNIGLVQPEALLHI